MKNETELEKAGFRGQEEGNRLFSPQSVKEKLNGLYGIVIAWAYFLRIGVGISKYQYEIVMNLNVLINDKLL